MTKSAILKVPYVTGENYVCGNVIWDVKDLPGQDDIKKLTKKLQMLGYWGSPFPEGDGLTWQPVKDGTTLSHKNRKFTLDEYQEMFNNFCDVLHEFGFNVLVEDLDVLNRKLTS